MKFNLHSAQFIPQANTRETAQLEDLLTVKIDKKIEWDLNTAVAEAKFNGGEFTD